MSIPRLSILLLSLIACAGAAPPAHSEPKTDDHPHMASEQIAADLVRVTAFANTDTTRGPVEPSIMLAPTWREARPTLPTFTVRAEASASHNCQRLYAKQHVLFEVCTEPRSAARAVTIESAQAVRLFGLGQHFVAEEAVELTGHVRSPGNLYGNQMVEVEGGAVGDTQIPILYAVGKNTVFAIFVDHEHALRWDFRTAPWRVSTNPPSAKTTNTPPLSMLIIAGPDLRSVRARYMSLVGRAPVPPKKAFGFWLSEYGFDSWKELDTKLEAVRGAQFPVDGVVLDLQWFGGITEDSEQSRMGSLRWDKKAFPQPAQKIEQLHDAGIGVIAIEESYVAKGLPEHDALAKRGYLVTDDRTSEPIYLDENPWWGQGGMIDWSRPDAAAYWHDEKRQPLVEMGLLGHWTDLGEPEQFSEHGRYHGVRPGQHGQAAVHNLYNLLWSRSIFDGYARHGVDQRPLILTRSGTAGMQRYGTALWSGDIGSNLRSLHSHLTAQVHVSLSGVDYYGTDIGGFKRDALRGDLDEMYTQWFANAMLFDIPARAHTLNLCNCHSNAPHEVGHLASNLENARLRYQLVPYLYSLAHAAHETGTPVIAPLLYAYPFDRQTHDLGTHKLIGDALLAVGVAREGAKQQDVYLPAGTWQRFDGSEPPIASEGAWQRDVPLEKDEKFVLPLYALAGAIVPLAPRPTGWTNVFGDKAGQQSSDGVSLHLRVFADEKQSRFTLVDDDGKTQAYQHGKVRKLTISQQLRSEQAQVQISAAQGAFDDGRSAQSYQVEWIGPGDVREVRVDDQTVPRVRNLRALSRKTRGWYPDGRIVRVNTGELKFAAMHKVTIKRAPASDS